MFSFLKTIHWPWTTKLPHEDEVRAGLNRLQERETVLPQLVRLVSADRRLLRVKGDKGNGLLHLAASCGNGLEAVHQCLTLLGMDPNARDAAQETPLHYCTVDDTTAVAAALVQAGADINARDYCGCTPLHQHLLFSDRVSNVAQWLLDQGANASLGADFDQRGEWTFPMDEAVRMQNVALGVDLVVKGGASLENNGFLACARKKAFLDRVQRELEKEETLLMELAQA